MLARSSATFTEGAPLLRSRRAQLLLASVAGLVALAAAGFAFVREWFGVTFSSDTYSYLVWAHRAVEEGQTGHVRYDFTAPKPLELFVATLGEVLGAPIDVFGWWAVLSFLLAAAAAAALAWRVAGRRAAFAAGVLALTLPGLLRQGFAADSTVPYAACIVGAAAAGAGRPGASALLGIGGLIRPETWGLAALSAALGWRGAGRRERIYAIAAAAVPPVLWLSFDHLATGDALYGTHALERFGIRPIPLGDLPGIVERLVPHEAGWLPVALALVGLGVGLRRRPLDAAVVFPVAVALGLILQVELEMIGRQSFSRYVTGLLLFVAAGGGIVLGSLRGRLGLAALAFGLVLSIAAVSGPLERIYRFERTRGRVAAELGQMGTIAREATPAGALVATERPWQGALSLYSGIPRERIVPITAVRFSVDPAEVRTYLVLPRRGGRVKVLAGRAPTLRSTRWNLYLAR